MDGIDASIYGQLQPSQPMNLLGMGMNAAYMANAMNQNRMFQYQLQARQGFADAAQANLNPDGSINYPGMTMALFKDIRTSQMAPQFMTQMLQNGSLQQDIWKKTMDNYAEGNKNLGMITTPLLMNPNTNNQDVISAIVQGVGKLYPADTAVQALQQLQPEVMGPNGQMVIAPSTRQHITQLAMQFEENRKMLGDINGVMEHWNTPYGEQFGQISQFTGVHPGPTVGGGALQPNTDVAGSTQQVMPTLPQGFNPFPAGSSPVGNITGFGDGGGSVGMGGASTTAPGQVQSQALPATADGKFSNIDYVKGDNPALDNLIQATRRFESGGRANATSDRGARGTMQIIPGTFADFARKGEDPFKDSNAVGARILTKYMQDYNGDVGRAATAYFSGPGNVAPANSAQPYLDGNRSDGHNTVAQYVANIQRGMASSPNATNPGQGGTATQAVANAPPATQVAQNASAQGQAPGQNYVSTGIVSKLPGPVDDYQNGKGALHDYETSLTDQRQLGDQNNLVLNAMRDLLHGVHTGRGMIAVSEFARVIDSLGFHDAANSMMADVGAGKNNDALNDAVAFMKLAIPQAFTQARLAEGGGKMTNFMANAFTSTQPSLEMPEGAIQKMIDFNLRVQDINNKAVGMVRSEYQALLQEAERQGRWTPQLVSDLQNIPQAVHDALVHNGYINYDQKSGKAMIPGY